MGADNSRTVYALWLAEEKRWLLVRIEDGIGELIAARRVWKHMPDTSLFVSTPVTGKRRRYDVWLRERQAEMRTERLL